MPVYRLMPEKTLTDKNGRKICEVFGAANGRDDLSLAWLMMPAGCRGPEGRNDHTEVVIVLSGKGRASIDGSVEDVGAGHAVLVPHGALWRLENIGREPLVCYSVCAPAFRAGSSQRVDG